MTTVRDTTAKLTRGRWLAASAASLLLAALPRDAHAQEIGWTEAQPAIDAEAVVAIAIEGKESIEVVRKLIGKTNSRQAEPGTIRGDYAHVSYGYADAKGIGIKNLIHASANAGDATREIGLWFKDDELHTYKTVHDVHVLE